MIRKICLAAVAAVMGAAFFAVPSGAAGVTPFKTTVKGTLDSTQFGTDLYWTTFEGRNGDSVVRRKSLVDGTTQTIARFGDTSFVLALEAGKNYVYASLMSDEMESPGVTGFGSKVVRIARDGSSITTLAEGKIPSSREVIFKNGKALLNDCGTNVDLESVSPTGAVAISQTVQDRESVACGGKANVDHVRYYELGATGVAREIYSFDARIKKTVKNRRNGTKVVSTRTSNIGIGLVSINGDRAAFSLGGKGKVYVRDLVTGGLTGPYKTGITGTNAYEYAMLDSAGRLALNGFNVENIEKKRPEVELRSGLVRTPGDPSSYTPLFKSKSVAFCGDHFISFSEQKVVEIDVQTLAPTRTIVDFGKKGTDSLIVGCLGDYVYVTRFKKRTETYLSYPLG